MDAGKPLLVGWLIGSKTSRQHKPNFAKPARNSAGKSPVPV
jgi:hypothetical protein